jgi:hypothetical protein
MRLYIVCHRDAYAVNHRGYTHAEAREAGLRWYVVNEPLTPKDIDAPPSCRVNEWDLPWHDPFMQMNHFYNNSALWHVYRNLDLLVDDHVGFAQYDMTIPRAPLDAFAELTTAQPGAVGYMFPYPFAALFHNPLPAEFWDHVIVRAAFPGRATLSDLSSVELPLFHGFILPKTAFLKMMAFADRVLPVVVRALGHDTRHLAGTLERVCALWIAAAVWSGTLGPVVNVPGFEHNQAAQRLLDAFRDDVP